MSIAEVECEEEERRFTGIGDRPPDTSLLSPDAAGLKLALQQYNPAKIVKTLSVYFDRSKGVGLETQAISPKGINELVYRDFPRHDGTPCLMFMDSPLVTGKGSDSHVMENTDEDGLIVEHLVEVPVVSRITKTTFRTFLPHHIISPGFI